ncbi:prenyltransferase [Cochleicola gelatinilyticus]|uniref:Prenyltransferase n=2 Tax=Cochleicola gelatinilyticus TaxID=1763537 RepID=A0A167HSX1_9FLAO|nr:prenyltransferase [Cochleicola gelatinilyticus]
MIMLIQLLIKFGLLIPLEVSTALDTPQFIILVFASVCIAAAGNCINDIYDVQADRINKPQSVIVGRNISEKSADRLYILLTLAGVGMGFYTSNVIGRPGFASIFIGVAALLYLYATYFKGMLLLKNLVVSLLVAFSLLIVILFDVYPAITSRISVTQLHASKVILYYAVFAFCLNFIREIVKDVQDINGDKNAGHKTLPIVIGRKRTRYIVFALITLSISMVIYFMYTFLYQYQFAVFYMLFLVVAPLLYTSIKAWSAETKKDFARLSLWLKGIMFSGMCSILLFGFLIL